MSQPVKLSDALVLDARLAAEPLQRSIAGQVEFWARLGRSVDLVLEGHQVLRLAQNGGTRSLSECLESVDTPEGRQRVADYLERQAFPHYRAQPGQTGVFERTDQDGTRTVGRFVDRKFVPVRASRKPKAAKALREAI
jgi:hypothetical protein